MGSGGEDDDDEDDVINNGRDDLDRIEALSESFTVADTISVHSSGGVSNGYFDGDDGNFGFGTRARRGRSFVLRASERDALTQDSFVFCERANV
jgi:hypothetical protein